MRADRKQETEKSMNAVRLCLALTTLLLTTRSGLADDILGTWRRVP
jgi:hypothetical protein